VSTGGTPIAGAHGTLRFRGTPVENQCIYAASEFGKPTVGSTGEVWEWSVDPRKKVKKDFCHSGKSVLDLSLKE